MKQNQEITLRRLGPSDEAAFLKALAAWDSDPGFLFVSGYEPNMKFTDYLSQLDKRERGIDLAPGRVADTSLMAFLGDEIVGRVSLRHSLTEFLFNVGGHIGYGVLPAFRRCGFAKCMLEMTLPYAKALGIEKVLVTCDDGNVGSLKTIEYCGGVLENIYDAKDGKPLKRRYWIQL